MTFLKSNILILFLAMVALQVHAQKNKSNKTRTPHFIDGIELNRNVVAGSEIVMESYQQKSANLSIVNTDSSTTKPTEQIKSLQIKYAQLLNVEIEKTNNVMLYEFIDDWMDTKYRFGGSTKSGIDCSGFSSMLCKEVFKIQLPRMASEQYKACEKINKEDLTEGDLVFFNTRGGVSHVGVYLMNDYFIHSSTREGVMISSLHEDYYHNRFIGAGRLVTPEQQKIVQQD